VNCVDSEVSKCAAILHECPLGRVETCRVVGAGRPEPSAFMRGRLGLLACASAGSEWAPRSAEEMFSMWISILPIR
jgi:hypothetical protein